MTDTQRKAILLSLMGGASRVKACHAAGLPSSTFYDWLKKNKAFKEAVEEAEAEPVGNVEGACYRCAMRAVEDPRYFRFMAFYLERKAGWVKPVAPAPAHEHAENTGKTVQNVQSIGDGTPATNKPANLPACEPATSGKTVQNVQTTGDGAPASMPLAPVGAQRAAPAENPRKTVQNVQPARSSVAFKPADAPPVIPNLKAKIRETMDANRARR